MQQPADIERVRVFLSRAARRVTLILTIHGATTGLALVIVAAVANSLIHGAWTPLGLPSVGIALVVALLGAIRGWMHRGRIAAIVEFKAPDAKNLLVTASEVDRPDATTNGYVHGLIFREAAELASRLDIGRLFPLRGALTALTIAAALWLVAIRSAPPHAASSSAVPSQREAPSIEGVDVQVTAPQYLGGIQHVEHDPARLQVLAGSRLRLLIRAECDSIALETLERTHTLGRAPDRLFVDNMIADADGFIAMEPIAIDGRRGARRLIGISAVPDLPPIVRIDAPAHDQKIPDGHRTIELAVTATDDHAIASLRLRYTRVSGSGERYTFTEGEVPLTISRADPRKWTARASWNLDSLQLGPGDMVVYRAVATDQRPDAAATESDSYIVEVLAPGGVAAAGFAIDPEVERYALSEQMVIVKTERLLARKAAIPADSFADAAADLAAEQRRVRAEYVFMMGGEVGGVDDAVGDLNEEAEASGEGDLAVQRMLNEGRTALLGAIRAMSRAATALTANDAVTALTHERTALAGIERTFSHTRIILRALSVRERIDMTRRLTGTLADAVRTERPLPEPASDSRLAELRSALADVAALAEPDAHNHANAGRVSLLAEQVLRIDPSSKPLQVVAAELDSAANALSSTRAASAAALLGSAATNLTRIMRDRLLVTPMAAPSATSANLSGALTEALRHPRRPR